MTSLPHVPHGQAPAPALHTRVEDGHELAFVVWRFARPWRVVATASVGGGIGARSWIINASVAQSYARTDLHEHVRELAQRAGLEHDREPGVGLLTGANVAAGFDAEDGGTSCRVSVGIRLPTWAAAPIDPQVDPAGPRPVGTINAVVFVPVPLDDGALVNVATTATEAKAQAMFDAGLPGTGTASDAVVVACPIALDGRSVEPFGGPRSTWGSRAARAVHDATTRGITHSLQVIAAHGEADPFS